MNYTGSVFGNEAELSVEKEGVRLGERFLDYADVLSLCPMNHRVFVDTRQGEKIEISMLGFSYDGFWKELTGCYGERSLESLFVEEEQLMLCEGEYEIPGESGRADIALYPDALCILPATCHAIRIPLCYTNDIRLYGYTISVSMLSRARYNVGKMGYDTNPFAERIMQLADSVKKERENLLSSVSVSAPYSQKGLFRTKQSEHYWNAAFSKNVCALEFFVGEDTATYLYRFNEPEDYFLEKLREATEAIGVHREVIYLSDEQIAQNSLYRMSVDRSEAVRFLRSKIDGRLIHTASHDQKLAEYLGIQ